MLESGDIFAVKGEGFLGKLSSKLMEPKTDRFHFGLIWLKTDWFRGLAELEKIFSPGEIEKIKSLAVDYDNDYVILESISKGPAVGRLSFYEGKDIKFYRVDCPKELRFSAPIELTKWGRSKYDYLLILRIGVQGLWLIFKHLITAGKLQRIRAEELTWSRNSSFICTEAVDISYDSVGVNIIPPNVCPTPSAFKQAELEGRMREIGKNT